MFTAQEPAAGTIIGPYAAWPRRAGIPTRSTLAAALGVLMAGGFVHCILPMLA